MSRCVNTVIEVVSLVSLAACAGSQPAPAPTVTQVAPPEAPVVEGGPLYAPLFVPRASTFPGFVTVAEGEVKDSKSTNVTCAITKVRAVGDDRELALECTGELALVAAPVGVLASTREGLVLRGAGPTLLSGEPSDLLLMGPTPVDGPVPQPRDSPQHQVVTQPFNGGWCIRTRWWSDQDDRGWTLCIKDGLIIGGAGTQSGYGTTHDVRFGLVP